MQGERQQRAGAGARARAGEALGQDIEELRVRWGEAALDTEMYIVMYLYTRVGRTAALIGRPTTTRIPAHMDTLEANRIFRDQGDIRKISGVPSLVAQILQSFLGFYALELCDWALR